MKVTKDKITSVRVNREIFDALKKQGITPQSIVNDYVKNNVRLVIKGVKK